MGLYIYKICGGVCVCVCVCVCVAGKDMVLVEWIRLQKLCLSSTLAMKVPSVSTRGQ